MPLPRAARFVWFGALLVSACKTDALHVLPTSFLDDSAPQARLVGMGVPSIGSDGRLERLPQNRYFESMDTPDLAPGKMNKDTEWKREFATRLSAQYMKACAGALEASHVKQNVTEADINFALTFGGGVERRRYTEFFEKCCRDKRREGCDAWIVTRAYKTTLAWESTTERGLQVSPEVSCGQIGLQGEVKVSLSKSDSNRVKLESEGWNVVELESLDNVCKQWEKSPNPPPPFPIKCPEGTVLVRGDGRDVQDLCVDKTEVTVDEYGQRCAPGSKCDHRQNLLSNSPGQHDVDLARCNWKAGRGSHPMNCITFQQAEAYCGINNRRLLTLAEFKWVAGGARSRLYPWGTEKDAPTCERVVRAKPRPADEGCDREGMCGCGENTTAPVCSRTAGNSADGVCDLSGNVAEFVAVDALRTGQGLVCGGHWASPSDDQLEAGACGNFDVLARPYSGFRCAHVASERHVR